MVKKIVKIWHFISQEFYLGAKKIAAQEKVSIYSYLRLLFFIWNTCKKYLATADSFKENQLGVQLWEECIFPRCIIKACNFHILISSLTNYSRSFFSSSSSCLLRSKLNIFLYFCAWFYLRTYHNFNLGGESLYPDVYVGFSKKYVRLEVQKCQFSKLGAHM